MIPFFFDHHYEIYLASIARADGRSGNDCVIRFVPDLFEKVPSFRFYRRTLPSRPRSFSWIKPIARDYGGSRIVTIVHLRDRIVRNIASESMIVK